MSAWPEETLTVKQIQNYLDLQRRAENLLKRKTIIDDNLKNDFFNGNAPANHTNAIYSPGSVWFITVDSEG